MDLITKAIIMAGGKGSRLKPYTDMVPKPMLDVNGTPLLRIMIEKLHSFGITHFYLSVNYLSKVIRDYFEDGSKFGVEISYIEEPFAMGTAGSIGMIDIDEPFLVINGDIYTELDFRDFFVEFRQSDSELFICCRNKSFKVDYGIIHTLGNYLQTWEEKPVYDHLISCGIYVMRPSVIKYIPEEHFFNMNHLVDKVIQDGSKVAYYKMNEETAWIDMGSIKDYEKLVHLLTNEEIG